MTMLPFEKALEYLINNEGSKYSNDPLDKGGPTKFGVTQKSYESFVNRTVSDLEMQGLTLEAVKAFYFHMYWKRLKCDRVADRAIATAIFDTGVLYGVSAASELVQQTLLITGDSGLKIDGILGDKTLNALNQVSRVAFIPELSRSILHRIEEIIIAKPQNLRFYAGWKNRAERLLTLASPGPNLTV